MKALPKILVINPGSTSMKLGYFEGENALEIIQMDKPENLPADDDYTWRKDATETFARDKQVDLIMARGGILKPIPSGVYKINPQMLGDLKKSPYRHASNFAAPIAYELEEKLHVPAYIADPVTVDEMHEIARYSGHPMLPRKSIFHALNHKATARKFAEKIQRKYEDLNLIVVHMGGGISIGAHKKGKVVDVNQALDGEGPFSPQRSGTLPMGDTVRLAFSGKFSEEQILKMITGESGLKAYTGTDNVRQIEKNDEQKKFLDAMVYQISKYIGEMAVVLQGQIDAIILTGGLAHSEYITSEIKKHISFLGPVYVFPGENEMEALAYNGLLVSTGKLKPKEYK